MKFILLYTQSQNIYANNTLHFNGKSKISDTATDTLLKFLKTKLIQLLKNSNVVQRFFSSLLLKNLNFLIF